MTETTKKEPTKKKSKAVTSALGEPLMAELEAAAKLTGESQAELVRCVFEKFAPTAAKIAAASMFFKGAKAQENLRALTKTYEQVAGEALE